MAGVVLQIQADAVCRRTCDFCSIRTLDETARNMELAEIIDNLRFFEERDGIDELVLASGEPTDRPDFAEILDAVTQLGSLSRLTVVSRGYRWSRDDILDRVKRLPLRVVFSFDAWTQEDLDRSSKRSLWRRASETIHALSDAGAEVASNSVLDTTFLGLLPHVALALADLPVSHSTLTFPFPKGGVVDSPTLVPTPTKAREALHATTRVFERIDRPYSIKGMPICHVPEFKDHIYPTKNRLYVTSEAQFGEALSYIPDRLSFVKTPECASCVASDACDGTWTEYLNRTDFPPLRAIS